MRVRAAGARLRRPSGTAPGASRMKTFRNLRRFVGLACLAVPVLLLGGCWDCLPSSSLTVTNSSAYPLQAHYDSRKLDIFFDDVLDPTTEDLGPGQTKTFDVYYDDYGVPELVITGAGFEADYADFDTGSTVVITQLQLSRNG